MRALPGCSRHTRPVAARRSPAHPLSFALSCTCSRPRPCAIRRLPASQVPLAVTVILRRPSRLCLLTGLRSAGWEPERVLNSPSPRCALGGGQGARLSQLRGVGQWWTGNAAADGDQVSPRSPVAAPLSETKLPFHGAYGPPSPALPAAWVSGGCRDNTRRPGISSNRGRFSRSPEAGRPPWSAGRAGPSRGLPPGVAVGRPLSPPGPLSLCVPQPTLSVGTPVILN